MKRQFTYLVLTAGLSAILGSSTVSAQDQRETANIPFAFHANKTTLPAGKYTIAQATNGGVFRMYDVSGRGIFVGTDSQDRSKVDNPRLTFACYGANCLLSEIWMSDGRGYGVAQSQRDKEAARHMGMAANLRSVSLSPR